MRKWRIFLDMLLVRLENKNYDHMSYSICNSITYYMTELLDQKLNKEIYKGLVTYCGKGEYTRYYDADFKKALGNIGYRPISQTIPESEKVDEYLAKRLRDHLGTQIEQSKTERLKGGASAGVVSGEGEIVKSTKQVHERAETFIGLKLFT